MSEALLVCPKCGGERVRSANKRGYVCVSCEKERKRVYAKKRMVARRKEEKAAVVSVDSPEPVAAAPLSLDPEAARDSAVILALHQQNLGALRNELEEVVRLRERGATISAEKASQAALINRLVEAEASNEELGEAGKTQAGLEIRLKYATEHQHEAELSLHARLYPDILAITRLQKEYFGFELDRETDKFLGLLVKERRDGLWEECRKCAEASICYRSSLASVGEYLQSGGVWSRPLYPSQSQKTFYSTQLGIKDALYDAVQNEETVRSLLEQSGKAIGLWDRLLAAVAARPGFALPSYEEPVPVPEIPPTYPDTTKQVNLYWTQGEIAEARPPHEKQTFTQPGAAE
jgi:hypothetical protein